MVLPVKFYDTKDLVKGLFLCFCFLLVCKVTNSLVFPILLPMAFFLLLMKKTIAIVSVVFFATLSLVLSEFFIYKSMSYAVSQKLLMLMLSICLLPSFCAFRHNRSLTPLLFLFWYLLYMLMVSQFGWSPVISNMKMLLFVLLFVCYYAISLKIINDERVTESSLRTMILVFVILLVVGSLLVSPFPEISQLRYERLLMSTDAGISLFTGLTNHSQALGPMMAILSVFLFADLVFSIQKSEKLYIVLLLLCPYLIYKTSSRTAMGSYIIGMLFVSFIAFHCKRFVQSRWRRSIVNAMFFVGFIGVLSVFLVPSIREKATMFVAKTNEDVSELTTENIMRSREAVLDNALYNWRMKPVTGNGFQVSELYQNVKINGIKDIISAPVEKSTWTYAILEEGGIIGLIIFLFFILISICLMLKRNAYVGASLLFTFIVINFGEFTMFSMSGVGGFYWLLVFLGIALDVKRNRRNSQIL